MRLLRYTLLLGIVLASCQGSDDISFNPEKTSGNDSKSGQGGGGFGDGNISNIDLSGDGPVDYPVTEYAGSGNLTSIEKSNPLQVKMRQEISREKLISYTDRFTSSDKEINKRVVNLVGHTTYIRVPKIDLANRAHDDPAFRNEPFLMFASSSETINKTGTQSFTFSSPMPFIVIPAEMNSFEVLKTGAPPTYTFRAKGGDGSEFDVTITISYSKTEGDIINIIQTTIITQDTNGRLYDKFPLPQTLEYSIDTKSKKVTKLRTATIYYNTKLEKQRNMTMDLFLCKYTLKGQAEGTCPF